MFYYYLLLCYYFIYFSVIHSSYLYYVCFPMYIKFNNNPLISQLQVKEIDLIYTEMTSSNLVIFWFVLVQHNA